jgi:hypothetical protein
MHLHAYVLKEHPLRSSSFVRVAYVMLLIIRAVTLLVGAFPEAYRKRFTPEKYADSAMLGRELMIQAVGQHPYFPL